MENVFGDVKLNNVSGVKVFSGDFKAQLTERLKELSPLCKIAFISFAETHEKFTKSVNESVFQAGGKVISLILPKPARCDVIYASYLFNLSDDVRAVLIIDRELFRIASYFAAVRNLPLIFAPDSACAFGTFEKTFYLKNGDKYDSVCGAKDIHVVIDENMINREIAEGYAFNMARVITLIDYKVAAILFLSADAAAYGEILDGVTGTYGVLSVSPEKRAATIFYYGLKIALADRAENFSFIQSSSERIAACLFAGGLNPSPQTEFYYALKILELYSVAFGISEEQEIFPDYLNRAEKVAAALNISQKSADEELLKNVKTARKRLSAALRLMNRTHAETEELLSHESGILGTYYSLGGKTVAINCELIRYAGDAFFGVNALSFLRETGITENTDIKR